LRLWVTDAPGGAGNTVLTLNITAAASDQASARTLAA
jgi:hypothetical protein